MGDQSTVPVGVLVVTSQRSETHLTGETTLDYPLHGEQSRCMGNRAVALKAEVDAEEANSVPVLYGRRRCRYLPHRSLAGEAGK